MFDPRMPFVVAQAIDAGLTHHEVRTAFTRVLEGVYVDARVRVSPRTKAQAALMVHPPGAVLSHDTVLRLLGAPVDLTPWDHVTVASDKDRRQRRGIRPHAMTLRLCDVGDLGGLPATVVERTFIDMAGRLPLVELVVLGDWLVRQSHTTPDELVRFCADSPARYAARAVEAARFVRPRVDSPSETRTRMLLVLAGLPEPETGVEDRDEEGNPLMQIDMVLRLEEQLAAKVSDRRAATGIAIEYDGRDHDESDRRAKDAVREDRYAELRLRPIKVTRTGLYRHPDQTVRRVYDALRFLGWPSLRPPTSAWRVHFER